MSGPVDLLVIGGGPAGLSAALQAVRDGLTVRLVTDEPPGGLLNAACRLANFPGHPGGIDGRVLARVLVRHVRSLGIEPERNLAAAIGPLSGRFQTRLSDGRAVDSGSVVLATGTLPRPPDFPAPACRRVVTDIRPLPLRLGRTGCRVAVVGGGEAALDSALSAVRRGGLVTVLVRGEAPKAPGWLTAACIEAGVAIRCRVTVRQIGSSDGGLYIDCGPAAGLLEADWAVLCIGRSPRAELCPAEPCPGLFRAGDLSAGHDRFALAACGSGQLAARLALAHLNSIG